ncbi:MULTISPECIES: HNH endonuclease [unclassified Sphingomonas]|jgi:hypothetical protein|uniref:HNH endonuclease n=1 Tax=unclassified Sphingomonas TaxID=196159 RepID=UPI0012E3BAFB|nr:MULTISPECIES: HNH endonuclease signature motif containing protein [unclassified Sphingomonas]
MANNTGIYGNVPLGIGLGVSNSEVRKLRAWRASRSASVLEVASAGGGDVRVDDYGNLMRWDKYGDFNHTFGWEVDHIQPRALGGHDAAENLRALNCKANRSLGGILSNALSGRR